MGYYTYLSIEIDREEPTVEQVAETVADVAKDTDFAFWRSALTGETEVKWYDGTADMKQVSRRYPEAVLTLRGEGEDPDDRWVEYHWYRGIRNVGTGAIPTGRSRADGR